MRDLVKRTHPDQAVAFSDRVLLTKLLSRLPDNFKGTLSAVAVQDTLNVERVLKAMSEEEARSAPSFAASATTGNRRDRGNGRSRGPSRSGSGEHNSRHRGQDSSSRGNRRGGCGPWCEVCDNSSHRTKDCPKVKALKQGPPAATAAATTSELDYLENQGTSSAHLPPHPWLLDSGAS